ncbi:acid resistance serine protease MarP [Gordonia defluvii]|uniref:Acid resistance serine protease MarP n=1 Tax=Gordonia defluvii TaxID=283718 RepID=A0ABP6LHN4_9ACTN|nr:MarP family serine protease [Gordonia sp. UBA5067]
MTAGLLIDVALVILVVIAGISGYRQGALASAMSLVGLVIGAVAGILVAPRVISGISATQTRLIVGIAVLVALVVVGEIAGMVVGRTLRERVRSTPGRTLDSVVGLALQALAVVAAAWLLATPIRDSSLSAAASAVDESRVLTAVGNAAPSWLRGVPDRFRSLLNESGLPDAIGPYGRATINPVDPPNQQLSRVPAVSQARASVVKIRGEAPACQRALEGSGFVFAPERVMTNAHVVAGTNRVTVHVGSAALPARVVLFDPRGDVAVLAVPGLADRPLRFAERTLSTGADAIALGYPEDGPFLATPLRVRGRVNLTSPDIYGVNPGRREAYTLRGDIRPGNSGGPMITAEGEVAGMVFGASDKPRDETGFALTAAELRDHVARSSEAETSVPTGTCIAG